MKKTAILTALSVMTMVSFANAQETSPTKPVVEKPAVKKNMKPEEGNNTAKKMRNHAPKGTGSRAMAHFKKMDKDSDEKISQSEFTAFHSTIFSRKDRNKDGYLSPAELSPTLAKAAKQTKN